MGVTSRRYSLLGHQHHLDDLTDVVITSPANHDILIYDTATGKWINSPFSVFSGNPTALVGLAAVNGSASTFMRSDGAPALDQSIAPTWTATHIFAKVGTNAVATLELNNTSPQLLWDDSDAGANAKNWQMIADTAFTFRLLNDARNAAASILAVTRSANAVSSLSFGNATDNPTFNFLGTGLTTLGGSLDIAGVADTTISRSAAGLLAVEGNIIPHVAYAPTWTAAHSFTVNSSLANASDTHWTINCTTAAGNAYTAYQLNGVSKLFIGSAGTNDAVISGLLANDAFFRIPSGSFVFNADGGGLAILKISQTAFTFGNTTNNPTFSFLGTGIITSGGVYQGPAGAATVNNLTYGFSGDTNSGIYSAGADEIGFGTNGALRFVVSTDGRIYGKGLHNAAGAVTGTANQYIASGTYTPTLTNVTNVAASTARQAQWMRVGNVVTVAGQVDIDPTAAGATELGVSLPIASALTTAFQLGGTANSNVAAGEEAMVDADAANDRARIRWTAVDVTNHTYAFTFTYEVL